ncbi:hypothetical protein CTAYLR_004145 [Chrysophaeum taylorii]|uniref:Mitochondrial inner membrane protease subunit n=1 Tax=Chrysophaeum taylorii TaxID=2483200 RepID=A0AAD7UL84_9STRA|nr:hypothetical protein CTAYLR_004145 [Chrysophaeum taylorii]
MLWWVPSVCALVPRTRELSVVFRNVVRVADYKTGECVVGECEGEEWCVRLYPNGRRSRPGERGRAGIFVERRAQERVAATFVVSLLGQKKVLEGRKIDVEGRGGAQFVGEGETVEPSLGRVTEAGCYLVVPRLLEAGFVDTNGNVRARLNITEGYKMGKLMSSNWTWLDARRGGLHVGAQFVPVWRDLAERRHLGALGCYGGVDYQIERITRAGDDVFDCVEGSTLHVRPAYPLVRRLERVWPVQIPEQRISLALRPRTYTAIFAATSAFGAILTLAFSAFLAASVFSIAVVPTLSMVPAIRPGEVLVIEKLSASRIPPRRNEVLLFSPPPALRALSPPKPSGRDLFLKRDLYVKRVVALPGDKVDLDPVSLAVVVNSRRPRPDNQVPICHDLQARDLLTKLRSRDDARVPNFPLIVPAGSVFVVGDCADVSVDSRFWGPLSNDYVVARPLFLPRRDPADFSVLD